MELSAFTVVGVRDAGLVELAPHGVLPDDHGDGLVAEAVVVPRVGRVPGARLAVRHELGRHVEDRLALAAHQHVELLEEVDHVLGGHVVLHDPLGLVLSARVLREAEHGGRAAGARKRWRVGVRLGKLDGRPRGRPDGAGDVLGGRLHGEGEVVGVYHPGVEDGDACRDGIYHGHKKRR